MLPLLPDTCYHIFNHANGFENIFMKEVNFYYFLEKYRLYISPIAETYAYCLMPNHFHLVVRIRKRATIEELIRNKHKTTNSTNNFSKVQNFGKVSSNNDIEKYLSKQFANLFSCYTQSFNKVYQRMGSLFIKNFKREQILDKDYFLNAIVYTHRNPIHHGFCKGFNEWEFSSNNEITEGICDTVELIKLLKTFGDLATFKEMHQHGLENLMNPELLEIPELHD